MSLAALKRKIEVGMVLQVVKSDNKLIIFNTDTPEEQAICRARYEAFMKPRKVSVVRTTMIGFESLDGRTSWLYWPNADCIRETPNGFDLDLNRDGKFQRVQSYEFK